jgi:hypothetical protein
MNFLFCILVLIPGKGGILMISVAKLIFML